MRRRTEVAVYVGDGGENGQAVERWFRSVGRGVLLHEQITGSNPAEVLRRLVRFPFANTVLDFILYFKKKNIYRYSFLSAFNHQQSCAVVAATLHINV